MMAGRGEIPDYQLSAWLMAAYLNPLDELETAALTQGMADSGTRIDLTGLPRPWVDKHSTGGVGDKATLVLLPLLAAAGLTIVKMSGRGLGITGGTIDKLASVPGFRLDLTPAQMTAQAAEIGLALTGQTPDLAPADKVLYALRDVTATVSSIPLIVSSILSKKIAGGAEVIMIDVKCGSGAFMPDFASARQLATALCETGRRCGLAVKTEITDMSQPLGSAVGNALEVTEALEVLKGDASVLNASSKRFRSLCIILAGETLVAAGIALDNKTGEETAERLLREGKALAKAEQWFRAQGSEWPPVLPKAAFTNSLTAEGKGYVAEVHAGQIGELVVSLGGGRTRKDDVIDPAVGITLNAVVGDAVETGDLLATIHSNSKVAQSEIQQLRNAIQIQMAEVLPRPLILKGCIHELDC